MSKTWSQAIVEVSGELQESVKENKEKISRILVSRNAKGIQRECEMRKHSTKYIHVKHHNLKKNRFLILIAEIVRKFQCLKI